MRRTGDRREPRIRHPLGEPAAGLRQRERVALTRHDERRLRDYAYPLIEPPYDRNKWYSAIGEVGAGSRPWPYPDRSAYASRLFTTAYRSQTARYNRLIEVISEPLAAMRFTAFSSGSLTTIR